jgi:hypothetical protein
MVFQIKFFPFINLLAILIAIAISFDNAFLLVFQFQKALRNARYTSTNDFLNLQVVSLGMCV